MHFGGSRPLTGTTTRETACSAKRQRVLTGVRSCSDCSQQLGCVRRLFIYFLSHPSRGDESSRPEPALLRAVAADPRQERGRAFGGRQGTLQSAGARVGGGESAGGGVSGNDMNEGTGAASLSAPLPLAAVRRLAEVWVGGKWRSSDLAVAVGCSLGW